MASRQKLPLIEIGDQVYIGKDAEEVGAVREVAPDGQPLIVVDIENAGDFTVPLEWIESVVEHKVVLAEDRLDERLREAARHAHDAEVPPSLEGRAP